MTVSSIGYGKGHCIPCLLRFELPRKLPHFCILRRCSLLAGALSKPFDLNILSKPFDFKSWVLKVEFRITQQPIQKQATTTKEFG